MPSEVAHHVRLGTGGGMGMKPEDRWCVPLCTPCHEEVHRGARTFERKIGRSLKSLAERLFHRFESQL